MLSHAPTGMCPEGQHGSGLQTLSPGTASLACMHKCNNACTHLYLQMRACIIGCTHACPNVYVELVVGAKHVWAALTCTRRVTTHNGWLNPQRLVTTHNARIPCTLADTSINPNMCRTPATPILLPSAHSCSPSIRLHARCCHKRSGRRVKAFPVGNPVGSPIRSSRRDYEGRKGFGVGALSEPKPAFPSFVQCKGLGGAGLVRKYVSDGLVRKYVSNGLV
eukprot:343122-Chlamydomonas_euryale.AAC.4